VARVLQISDYPAELAHADSFEDIVAGVGLGPLVGRAFKKDFLFLPAVSIVVGLWCTLLTCYNPGLSQSSLKSGGDAPGVVVGCRPERLVVLGRDGQISSSGFRDVLGSPEAGGAVILEMVREVFELPFVLTGALRPVCASPGFPGSPF